LPSQLLQQSGVPAVAISMTHRRQTERRPAALLQRSSSEQKRPKSQNLFPLKIKGLIRNRQKSSNFIKIYIAH